MGRRKKPRDSMDDTRSFRTIVLERDNHACVNCGRTTNLHIDHIIPISRGGQNILSNMQTLCETCNYIKANYMPDEAAARFADPRHKCWMERRTREIDIYGSIENKYKLGKLLRQMGIKNAWELRQELRATTSNPTT